MFTFDALLMLLGEIDISHGYLILQAKAIFSLPTNLLVGISFEQTGVNSFYNKSKGAVISITENETLKNQTAARSSLFSHSRSIADF